MSETTGTGTTSEVAAITPQCITVSFPLWVCVRTDTQTLLGGTVEGGHRFVALFASRDLAEQYLAGLGFSEVAEPIDIAEPVEDEQRVITGTAEMAVVGAALLLL